MIFSLTAGGGLASPNTRPERKAWQRLLECLRFGRIIGCVPLADKQQRQAVAVGWVAEMPLAAGFHLGTTGVKRVIGAAAGRGFVGGTGTFAGHVAS